MDDNQFFAFGFGLAAATVVAVVLTIATCVYQCELLHVEAKRLDMQTQVER